MNAPTAQPVEDLAALLASHRIVTRRAPSGSAWDIEWPEPPDLKEFYATTDGLALADGTIILPRGELARTTEWLKEDRSLDWAPDLVVIGERDDLVIVRDLDVHGKRAGGGVLETPTDGLESFRRLSYGLVEYLILRTGLDWDAEATPERAAQEAARQKDVHALVRVIDRSFYPGAERELAHAALVLGAILAGQGDAPGALSAFGRSVEARTQCARRGAEATERTEAWRACARAAEQAGAAEVAETCRLQLSRPA